MNDSKSHVNFGALEHSKVLVYFVKVLRVSSVLVLSPVCEKSHAHVLDSFFKKRLSSVKLVKSFWFLVSSDNPCANRSFVHLDLLKGFLAFCLLLFAKALQICWDFSHVFGFKLFFLLCECIFGNFTHLDLHFSLADLFHVALDEVFLIHHALLVLIDKLLSLNVDRLRLQTFCCDLGWDFCKLLHLKRDFHL